MPERFRVHVCISRDSGPQCGYVGYGEAQEASRAHVPTHIHRDANGRFRERAWGPLADCREKEDGDA